MTFSPSAGAHAAGALVALAVMVRLFSILPEVPNVTSMTYDPSRRAILNVEAADALRSGNLPSFIRYIAGPETWPTLRMAVAAPVHAVVGPRNAPAVETGVSIAFAGLLLWVVAFAATRVARDGLSAALVFAVAAAAILGNRPLFENAANGMLEIPAAALTLAAAAAWIGSRDPKSARPWAVAITGNLVFHTKWQHGMIFAAAVLLTEALEAGPRQVFSATLSAAARSLRRVGPLLFLVAAIALLGSAAWVAKTGGGELDVLGVRLSARTSQGPLAFGMLALFGYVQLALWHHRAALRVAVPERLRFLWVWLATPMAAWLLVPFTWRLRVLTQTSFTYDSGRAPAGLDRVLFYPGSAWRDWLPGEARWLFAALLVATAFAAWRSSATRRIVIPICALVAFELLLLTAASSRNFQPRFFLNLSPLMMVLAAAWIPAVQRPALRVVLAIGAAALFAGATHPLWQRPTLAATLSAGFWEPPYFGEGCRRIAQALPVRDGVLLNELKLVRKPTCAVWVKFVAREIGGQVHVHGDLPPGLGPQVLRISDGSLPPRPLPDHVPDSEPLHEGFITAQRYVRRTAHPGGP